MRERDSHQQHLVVVFLSVLQGLQAGNFSCVCTCVHIYVCVCVCPCVCVCVCPLAFQRVTLEIELHRSGSASATRESCQLPAPSEAGTN